MRHYHPLYYYSFIFLFFYAIEGYGQLISSPDKTVNDQLENFISYTIEDGLPNNTILDLLQDKYGFIWIATNYGLSIYNGDQFVNYYHNPKDSTSLSSNQITCLLEDENNNIWIGTKNGLNQFNRRNNTFKRFLHNKYDLHSLPDNHIRALFADEAGIIWLETANGNLSRFQIATNHFDNYPHDLPELRYPHHQIKRRDNGNLLITGRRITPKEFDSSTNTFSYIPNLSSLPSPHFISDILTENGVQLVTNSANLTYYSDDSFQTFKEFKSLGSVYDLLLDRKNQIWFGGYGGLARLSANRKTLTRFSPSNERDNALVHRIVNKVLEDQMGNIWIATMGGLSKLSPNQFISHIKNKNASNKITGITNASDSTIWLGTADEGIFLYNVNTNSYEQHLTEPDLISNRIGTLHQDKNSVLWIGHWSGRGFQKLDTKTGVFTDHRICSNTPLDWYYDILETKSGDIYLGTWGRGPIKYDKETNDISDEHLLPSYLKNRPISNFKIWKDQIIRIYAHLLYFYSPKSKKHLVLEGDVKGDPCRKMKNPHLSYINPPWTSKNKIWNYHVFESTLWVASMEGVYEFDTSNWEGTRAIVNEWSKEVIDIFIEDAIAFLLTTDKILKIDLVKNQVIENILLPQKVTADPPSLIPNKTKLFQVDHHLLVQHKSNLQVYDIEQSKWQIHSFNQDIQESKFIDNQLYISSKDSIYISPLDQLDPQAMVIQDPTVDLLNSINSIAITADHQVWCGTDKGLFYLNPKEQKAKVFFHDPSDTLSIPDDKIYQVTVEEDGHLWVATHKGLAKYRPSPPSFERHNQNATNGLSSKHTKCLIEDHKGNIWVGNTEGSLDCYDPQMGTFQHYFPDPNRENSLLPDPTGPIHCLFEDAQNRLWIGGEQLGLFHPATKTFTNYVNKQGEPFSQVSNIQEDKNNRLWITTNKGLFLFLPKDGSFVHYGLEDNIQGLNFNTASCQLSNGALVFGGANGFNIIDIDKVPKNNTAIELSSSLFNFQAGKSFIDNLPTDTTLSIKSTDFQVKVAMDALTKGNQYRYRLTGFEEDWTTHLATQSVIAYNNLPYGTYQLDVIPDNTFSGLSSQTQQINITIDTPIYHTTWFRAMLFIGGSLLIFLLTRYLYWRNAARREERQLQVQKAKDLNTQLQFLQLKSIQAQMNPHFIFNVLQSVQNLISNEELEEANKQVVDLSILIRHFLDASVEMDLGERGNFSHEISLEQELELLKLYVAFEHNVYKDKFNYHFEIPQEIAEGNYTLPPMLIQPIVENAIKHGLLPKKEKGTLTIRFRPLVDEGIECIIEDDGIGRKQSKKLKQSSTRQFKSRGFKLVEDKIQLLNQIGYNIQINTTDKPHDGGTIVSIIINRNYSD